VVTFIRGMSPIHSITKPKPKFIDDPRNGLFLREEIHTILTLILMQCITKF